MKRRCIGIFLKSFFAIIVRYFCLLVFLTVNWWCSETFSHLAQMIQCFLFTVLPSVRIVILFDIARLTSIFFCWVTLQILLRLLLLLCYHLSFLLKIRHFSFRISRILLISFRRTCRSLHNILNDLQSLNPSNIELSL